MFFSIDSPLLGSYRTSLYSPHISLSNPRLFLLFGFWSQTHGCLCCLAFGVWVVSCVSLASRRKTLGGLVLVELLALGFCPVRLNPTWRFMGLTVVTTHNLAYNPTYDWGNLHKSN